MTRHQTPYERGFRAGLIGQDYLRGDREYKRRDYLDWWKGWQVGKAARPNQAAWVSDAPPQPRQRQPFGALKKWAGQLGRKCRPEQPVPNRAARPQPRRPKEKESQAARRLQYLREVGRLGKVPF